jgi:hypothetical protein
MKSKPGSGVAQLHARPPLERMMRIHQAIAAGKYPNATTLARDIEVVPKTIHRDIEFMRDRLQLPIAYDERKYGYYYTEEVSSFPTLQITEGELVALLVAEKALQQYRGTHFEKPLLSAFKKMEASLPDTVSLNLADWDQTISFRTSVEPILNLEVFDGLGKATSHRQQLELTYRKPGSRRTEQRIVDPYHLANVNGECVATSARLPRRASRVCSPPARRSPGLHASRWKKSSATASAWSPARGNIRSSFGSTVTPPITSARNAGMPRSNSGNSRTAGWN